MLSHFMLQECGGISSLAALWQPRMRKHRQGSISQKFPKPEMRKHRQGSNSPPNSQNLSNYSPAFPKDAQDFKEFGEI